ncbi:MAG TPA: hypothetical protein VGL39_13445 [Jatrophihabitantaceae bacterium]|jgi:hypothetical protein
MEQRTTGEAADLASLLWQVREVVERAVSGTVELHQVAATGDLHGLAAAEQSLAATLRDLRGIEVLRAAEADALAGRVGQPPGATLAQLAEAADEPWTTILRDHIDALRRLTTQLDRVAQELRQALDTGGDDVQAARRTAEDARQLSLLDFLA